MSRSPAGRRAADAGGVDSHLALASTPGFDLEVTAAESDEDVDRGLLVRVSASLPEGREVEELLGELIEVIRAGLASERRIARLLSAHPEIADEAELLDLVEAALAHRAPSPPAGPGPTASGFTEQELAVFDEAGIDIAAASEQRAGWDTDVAMTRLLANALTVPQAAEHLGVADSRIRQRLNDRSLYGVKVGRAWRLPRFQFTEDGEVPNIGSVLEALPEQLHPLTVHGWVTGPKPDLWLDRPTSPRRWLLAGGDPGPVAELARHVTIAV
jgi:excisionase family DNA binding protein